MALDEKTVNIKVTDITNDSGVIIGYEAKYQDAGREYVISYDADFVKTGETVTKLYDVVDLTATDQSFQDAWGSIKNSFSNITKGQTLYFAEVNDSQLVVLGDENAILLRVSAWEGSHSWTGWDGTNYRNDDANYNFHDANWEHLGNAGTHKRYIVRDGKDDVLDEQGSNSGDTVNNAFTIDAILTDLNKGAFEVLKLDEVEVVQVQNNTSSWQGIDHELREDGFEPWSNSEKRVDLFKAVDGGMERIGQVVERDGFVEVYNENWESLARLVDGPGLSLEEVEAEFSGFTAAWTATESYMPSDFRPDLEANSLKFAIGEWDNILVFDGDGLLIGRVHVWEHIDTWTRYHDGDRYTVENKVIGFNFNDDEWNNIGRYEIQKRQYTEKNGEPLAAPIADETQIFTSYSLYESNATAAEWETFKGIFDLPTLTTEQQTQLGFTWADVAQISIGKSETTAVANQFRDKAETWNDTRVEYFREIEHEWGSHYDFMGSMEIRSGFIEVRDSDWNIVVRKIDISSARTLAEISAVHEGFQEAWEQVETYLPVSLKDPEVRFTSDDWNIYAFSAAGELVSNINFWNGEHTWEGWNGTEYRNVDSHYNFHDANWNSIANAGTFTRFASADGGLTEYLDEVGSNSGFTAVGAARDTLIATINDKVFTKLGISEGDVSSIRQNTHSWEAKDHDLRDDWFEPYENSNQRMELFQEETVGDHTHNKMVGSLETRGGFIEIYDANWNKVGQIISGDGLTIDQIEAKVAGFKEAFNAVLDDLPSEFGGDIKFALGDWDSILIFDDNDEMLSRVDVWTWTDPDKKYRNGEEYTRLYDSVTFNFNDANWNDIARYETFSSTYTEKAGEPLDTPILEEDGYFKSVAIFKDTTTTGAWNTFEDTYGLPDNVSSDDLSKLFTWDQVDQISVGTRFEKDYAIPEFNREAKTSEEGRVEYFKKHTDDYGNSWYEFLGVMENEGGFFEIRDANWNTVARVADTSQLQTWDQIKGDFIRLEESWDAVKASLPDEIKDPSTVKFSVGERELYAFAEDGTMYEIYFDNEIREYTRSGYEAFEMRYWYDFEEADGAKFADIGGHQDFVVVDGIEVPDNRIQKDEDGNPVNAPFTLNGELVQLTEQGLHSSSVIRKGAISDDDWAEFDPDNKNIDFAKVVEVEYGTGSWEGMVSLLRDNAHSDDRVQIEYYAEVENDGWYDRYRLGSLERDGNLETIYDANWNPIDQQLGGDVTGVPLTYLIEVENPYMKAAFEHFEGELASFFPNLNSIIVTMTDVRDDGRIEAALSDAVSGEILGTLEYDEWENSNNWGWNVHVQGIKGDNDIELFDISGHNKKGENPSDISEIAEDVGFATYTYIDDLTENELVEFKTKYSIMENAEGFNFDDVLKVKERAEIRNYDEGFSEYQYKQDVRFIEDIGDGRSNWDYFELENTDGYITIEDKAKDEIIFTTFIPQSDGETLRDLVGPEYDTILGNIISNHGDVISKSLAKLTTYDVTELTFHALSGDDIVAVDPDGNIVADGWKYLNVGGDGQAWWEITLRKVEDGERVIHIGGKNYQDEATGHLVVGEGEPNSTRIGEFFYKDDMGSADWISLLATYEKYFDKLPSGTVDNVVAIATRDMVTDIEGDGNYAGNWHEVRFAEADDSNWTGIDWDYDNNARIKEDGFGYEIFDGRNLIESGTDFSGVTFVAPGSEVQAKFNSTVADTKVLTDFMTQNSLKADSENSTGLVLQSNAGSDLVATVTDYGDYYGFRDPETSAFIAWISSDEGQDGDQHIGFGFDLLDLSEGMSASQKAVIIDFLEGTLGPSSVDYKIEDIADYRLVVKQVKDGDTITETYAYAQHLNANGGTLGSTGVDVTNSKFIQMYNRIDTDGDQVPDKVTAISAEETTNIYGSINAILDAVINNGTVDTLVGLDSSTTIEPMPSEALSDENVSAFIKLEPPTASSVITEGGTDALMEADITEVLDVASYNENEVFLDII